MSDINLDFTVSNNSINFTVEPNDITITPTDIQLNITSGGIAIAGGTNTQLQYNNAGVFGGIPNVTWNGSKLSLGNVANVQITGGTNGYLLQTDGTGNLIWAVPPPVTPTSLNANIANVHIYDGVNGYVLQTDGTGNLSWTAQTGGGGGNGAPGGANTQIQYNDSGSFGGNAGFTFNEVDGNVNMPSNLIVAGNIIGNTQTAYLANYATVANSIAGSNVSGQVNYAAVANSVTGSNVSGTVANATYAVTSGTTNSVSGSNVSGAVSYATTANSVAGANVSGTVANATYALTSGSTTSANTANTANTVIDNAQPNITSVGTLTSLIVTGNANVGNLNTTGIINVRSNTQSYIGNLYVLNNILCNSNIVSDRSIQFIDTLGPAPSAGAAQIQMLNGNINTTTGDFISTSGNFRTSTGNITTVSGNIIGNNLSANSNVSGLRLISTVANGIAPLVVTSKTLVANLNVANANYAAYAGNANILFVSVGDEIKIGNLAVNGGTQNIYSIAIGYSSGSTGQGIRSIAIGSTAGTNSVAVYDSVAIGYEAGSQPIGNNTIGIGRGAGRFANDSAISIGNSAGYSQSANSIAIGTYAGNISGMGANSIAFGRLAGNSATHDSSIIINASGVNLPSTQANSLFIKPIRDVTGNAAFSVQLYYNPTTGEVGYK